MRDLIFLGFIAASLLTTVRYPFLGLLLWAWFTLATPQQATYFATGIPLNVIIAGVAFLAFFFHGDFRRARLEPISLLLILFAAWIGLSHAMSLDQSLSAEPTDRFIKVLVFIGLIMMVTTDRLRFHAILWLLALVMGFYGAKGGFYTILTLGQNLYMGQAETILADNNHMGIALAASLPLFLYLAGEAKHVYVRRAILLVFALSIIAILGTHSRGALLSLLAFAGFMWWRSRHKLKFAVAAMILAVPALFLMPQEWTDRMETIGAADEDESFQGRVDAWVINYKLAQDNPITGAGLRTGYEPHIARQVEMFRTPRAAHSIYFEVLGGTGFVGLAIYLGLLGTAFFMAVRAEKKYADAERDRWRSPFGHYAQISLVTFCFGALSVSMEMWEGYLMVVALISVLGKIAPAAAKAPAPALSREAARIRARVTGAPDTGPALHRESLSSKIFRDR